MADPNALQPLGPNPSRAMQLSLAAGDVSFWDPGAPVEAFTSPSAWDRMVIGDDELPGIVRITGGRRSKLDVKNSPGTDAATLTSLGREPAEIHVLLRMWTPAQLQSWQRIVKILHPGMGKGIGVPWDVDHPALHLLGIHSLILVDVGVTQPGGEPGVTETHLRFLEFAPPVQVGTKTPVSSGHSTKVGQGKPQKMPSAEP